MFGSGKSFGGLGAGRPLDPAAEIQRLLNQHAAHWIALEKEIKDVKTKQEKASQAYAAALEAKEKARAAMLAAERGASEAEAALEHCRAELESSKAVNSKLEKEVGELREQCADVTRQADAAREQFNDHVKELVIALEGLKLAHPDFFIGTGAKPACEAAA